MLKFTVKYLIFAPTCFGVSYKFCSVVAACTHNTALLIMMYFY